MRIIKKKFVLSVLWVLPLFLALHSCKKESDEVGRSLQTRQDIIYTDTLFDISIVSEAEDSLRTSKVRSCLLGYVDDPVFGSVRADVYAQFRLSANAIDFGTDAVLDSVILSLPYAGFFGDTAMSLGLSVHELTSPINKDSSYYSTRSIPYAAADLVSGISDFVLHPLTPVVVTGETYDPQLRIPLDVNFFTHRFLDKSGSEELSDNAHFLPYFKGLSIVADSKNGAGCMAYVDILSSSAAVTLYYHNAEHDSLSFQLVSNDSSNYFSHIEHDFSKAEAGLQKQLQNHDYAAGAESFYLQGGSGVKAHLSFPTLLKHFEGKKLAVHKAELIVSAQDVADSYNPYYYPSALTMYYKKDSVSQTSYYLPDYLNIGSSYMGGGRNTEDQTYRFFLTQYIQYVLMGKMDASYPLYMIVNGASTQITRLKVFGPHSQVDPEHRMRLIVTYSFLTDNENQ